MLPQSDETSVLESISDETTVLSEVLNETTVLSQPANETTILSQALFDASNIVATAKKTFALDLEMSFIGSSELIE